MSGLEAAPGPRLSAAVPGELTSTTSESGFASSVATKGWICRKPSASGARMRAAPGAREMALWMIALRSKKPSPTLPSPRLPTESCHAWLSASDLPSLSASTTALNAASVPATRKWSTTPFAVPPSMSL